MRVGSDMFEGEQDSGKFLRMLKSMSNIKNITKSLINNKEFTKQKKIP